MKWFNYTANKAVRLLTIIQREITENCNFLSAIHEIFDVDGLVNNKRLEEKAHGAFRLEKLIDNLEEKLKIVPYFVATKFCTSKWKKHIIAFPLTFSEKFLKNVSLFANMFLMIFAILPVRIIVTKSDTWLLIWIIKYQ